MRFQTKTVSVTRSDIVLGERGGCGGPASADCPIGLALRRALKLPEGTVMVWLRDWVIVDGDTGRKQGRWRALPAEACRFRLDFDMGNPVKPFKFSIRVAASVPPAPSPGEAKEA